MDMIKVRMPLDKVRKVLKISKIVKNLKRKTKQVK